MDTVDLKNAILQAKAQAESADADAFADARFDDMQGLTWQAPEYTHHPKGTVWRASLFAGTALLIVAMIALENYTAAVFFALAGVVIYLYGDREPRVVTFGIDGRGVRVGNRLFPYDDLRSFWVFYDPGRGRAELSLRSRHAIMPYVRIPLGDLNPADVHRAISPYLTERRHADSPVDTWARMLRF